ncbi:MAG: radical SAM protein [Planctomycetes bacterium]|nr:radical SAM protein [Planctomycetota bacterium]
MYDRFNRRIHYLRLSVTDLCNLRCQYCMPAEGIQLLRHEDILTFEEMTDVVREAVELGIDKVRLTGGEPLVRRGILDLTRMIGKVPGIKDFAMTTNGTLLTEYAADLRAAGIQRLNISLDTVDTERYREITRVGDLKAVLEGIHAAQLAGFEQIKLNCVIQASSKEPDAVAVASFGRTRGMEVRFIRQMDTAQGQFWQVQGGEGGHCTSCNRLRVSSDGKVYPCLFSDRMFDVRELSIKKALQQAVDHKPETGQTSRNRFYQLGG